MSKDTITLSPTHAANPSLEQCFLCMEEMGVILFGKLPDDAEAPRKVCLGNHCARCAEHMKLGIITISVNEALTTDAANPYRSGGWCVLKEHAVRRLLANSPDLLEQVIEKRVMFVPDDAWDHIGLPRAGTGAVLG